MMTSTGSAGAAEAWSCTDAPVDGGGLPDRADRETTATPDQGGDPHGVTVLRTAGEGASCPVALNRIDLFPRRNRP